MNAAVPFPTFTCATVFSSLCVWRSVSLPVASSKCHGILQLVLTNACFMLRYGGLSGSDSYRREWHKLIMCIEGPEEPSKMDAFLEPLYESLDQLGPPRQQQPLQQEPPDQGGKLGMDEFCLGETVGCLLCSCFLR